MFRTAPAICPPGCGQLCLSARQYGLVRLSFDVRSFIYRVVLGTPDQDQICIQEYFELQFANEEYMLVKVLPVGGKHYKFLHCKVICCFTKPIPSCSTEPARNWVSVCKESNSACASAIGKGSLIHHSIMLFNIINLWFDRASPSFFNTFGHSNLKFFFLVWYTTASVANMVDQDYRDVQSAQRIYNQVTFNQHGWGKINSTIGFIVYFLSLPRPFLLIRWMES